MSWWADFKARRAKRKAESEQWWAADRRRRWGLAEARISLTGGETATIAYEGCVAYYETHTAREVAEYQAGVISRNGFWLDGAFVPPSQIRRVTVVDVELPQ